MTEDEEVASALLYVRDALFPPDTPPDAVLRFCVLDVAASIEAWRGQCEMARRDSDGKALH